MKLGLIENAWWGSPVPPLQAIELTKEIGFDVYDLMPQKELLMPEKRAMQRKFTDVGLPRSSMNLLLFSAMDINSAVRRFTIDWGKKQFDFAFDMECEMVTLVFGEYAFQKQELQPELQWKWAVEAARELGDHAESLGMGIALEMLTQRYALLNSVEIMKKFLAEVDHPRVKANADVSHLFLNGDPPQSLNGLKGNVAHVHFSDCKKGVHGDLPPGRGDVPLREYLRSLKTIGFDGSVIIELEWSPQPEMIREWVKEAYDSTAKMMDDLKIRS
jgi:sugar phosphate isomerase/epimerase